jgi:hypothetical protein
MPLRSCIFYGCSNREFSVPAPGIRDSEVCAGVELEQALSIDHKERINGGSQKENVQGQARQAARK